MTLRRIMLWVGLLAGLFFVANRAALWAQAPTPEDPAIAWLAASQAHFLALDADPNPDARAYAAAELDWLIALQAALHAADESAGGARYRHDGSAILNDLAATPGKADPALTAKKLCAAGFHTSDDRHVTESTKKRICEGQGRERAAPDGLRRDDRAAGGAEVHRRELVRLREERGDSAVNGCNLCSSVRVFPGYRRNGAAGRKCWKWPLEGVLSASGQKVMGRVHLVGW